MTDKEIENLVTKFFNGTASKEEEAKLHDWYDKQKLDHEEVTIITDGEDKPDVKKRLFFAISTKLQEDNIEQVSFKAKYRKRLPYAAAIIFIFLSGVYFFLTDNTNTETVHYTQLLKNDIGPGGENAILELGNGKQINLDSTKIGDTLSTAGIWLTKAADGMLSLDIASAVEGKEAQQNTIRTPKGGHFHLQLPDGTSVWLNASTTISFPSAFGEDKREVQLEGEAYFEVVKVQDAQRKLIPFVIKTPQQQINVLGTSFNVNSYPGEPIEYTTLSEGSVEVTPIGSKSSKILQPGEQSLIHDNKISIQTADLESILAWKNGDFIFNQESLYTIMKKLERWYDIEVVFDKNVDKNRTFSGAISRSRNLSDVLKLMELTKQVTFKIEGRRVLVMK